MGSSMIRPVSLNVNVDSLIAALRKFIDACKQSVSDPPLLSPSWFGFADHGFNRMGIWKWMMLKWIVVKLKRLPHALQVCHPPLRAEKT